MPNRLNLHRRMQPAPVLAVPRMPVYFFHLHDDMEVAMACAEVLKGHLRLRHRIEVADDAGTVLLTVHFKDVVAVEV